MPTSDSDRSYRSRRAGASTGSPIRTAEKLACAAVPAARTTQRYLPVYSWNGLKGFGLVEAITLFVSR